MPHGCGNRECPDSEEEGVTVDNLYSPKKAFEKFLEVHHPDLWDVNAGFREALKKRTTPGRTTPPPSCAARRACGQSSGAVGG